MDSLPIDELNHIVEMVIRRREYQREWKRDNPPSADKRKEWNKAYYERRKQRADFKETQRRYAENGKVNKQHRNRYYYYKKTNQLDILKIKYPETYNMCVKV